MKLSKLTLDKLAFLKATVARFNQEGVTCYVVGGFVRDMILDIDSDDIDICLVGAKDYRLVSEILGQMADGVAAGDGDGVGNKFPVWIADYKGLKVDFALARKEMKSGHTRQDFLIDVDGVSIEDDLLRRDLTINALALDLQSFELVDPFDGVKDLQDKTAQPVSKAFAEDPLRVYRAGRFCARFNLFPSSTLIEMAKRCDHIISSERIGAELLKTMKQGNKIQEFFYFLHSVDWLKYKFDFLYSDDLDKSRMWKFLSMNFPVSFSVLQKIAILFQHEDKKTIHSVLKDLSFLDKAFHSQVSTFVENLNYVKTNPSLSREDLAKVKRSLDKIFISEEEFFQLARHLKIIDDTWLMKYSGLWTEIIVEPIVSGKKLLELGVKQGPKVGQIMKKCLSLQDKGVLTSENYMNYLNLNLYL